MFSYPSYFKWNYSNFTFCVKASTAAGRDSVLGSEQFVVALAAHHPYRARERPDCGRGRSAERGSDERLGGVAYRRTRGGLVRKASRDANSAC